MSPNSKIRAKCYDKLSVPYGDTGSWRLVARYTCAGCQTICDVPTSPALPLLSTEAHRAYLSNRNWWMNGRGSEVMCPTCFTGREKDFARMAAIQNQSKDSQTIEIDRPLVLVQPPKEPTPGQRSAIRAELDSCFVAEDGEYIDGESDETIAKRLNIPWSWVETSREASYGKIRVTTEMRQMRAEAAAVRTALDQLAVRMDEHRRNVMDEINALRVRLAAVMPKAA